MVLRRCPPRPERMLRLCLGPGWWSVRLIREPDEREVGGRPPWSRRTVAAAARWPLVTLVGSLPASMSASGSPAAPLAAYSAQARSPSARVGRLVPSNRSAIAVHSARTCPSACARHTGMRRTTACTDSPESSSSTVDPSTSTTSPSPIARRNGMSACALRFATAPLPHCRVGSWARSVCQHRGPATWNPGSAAVICLSLSTRPAPEISNVWAVRHAQLTHDCHGSSSYRERVRRL
jgi:hypothetical protein